MTYVLIPGAGGSPWSWHLVEPELRARGHDVVAVDLPCDDDSAGLDDYVATVVAAIGPRRDLVVVGHSMGALTATLVCDRLEDERMGEEVEGPASLIRSSDPASTVTCAKGPPREFGQGHTSQRCPSAVERLVLVAAMVPVPGESPGDWWANTGWEQARQAEIERHGGNDSIEATFLHDVPAATAAEANGQIRDQSDTPFAKPWPLDAWPDVETRFVLCTKDRFFPADFQRRVVGERLAITPDELDSGHLPMLSRPIELVDLLESYDAR